MAGLGFGANHLDSAAVQAPKHDKYFVTFLMFE